MFRSSTIIRELALNLNKVMLKHSVKLRPYLLCGCVAACHGMACVLRAATRNPGKTTDRELQKFHNLCIFPNVLSAVAGW